MSSPNTIRLDVGGTVYRVSKSLLVETFPESMLARLVSDRWNKPGTTEIFIDRNGRRFEQVLDFLRDPNQVLMHLTPDLCRELDYFGLPYKTNDASDEKLRPEIPPGLRRRAVQAGISILQIYGSRVISNKHENKTRKIDFSYRDSDGIWAEAMGEKLGDMMCIAHFLSFEQLSEIWIPEYGIRCVSVIVDERRMRLCFEVVGVYPPAPSTGKDPSVWEY